MGNQNTYMNNLSTKLNSQKNQAVDAAHHSGACQVLGHAE